VAALRAARIERGRARKRFTPAIALARATSFDPSAGPEAGATRDSLRTSAPLRSLR